jgi:glucosylceramidase
MGVKATYGAAKRSTIRTLKARLVLGILAVAIGAEPVSLAEAAHLPRLADIRSASAASPGLSVRGWLTTPDQSDLAQALAPSSFTKSPAPGALDLSVDPSTRFQSIVGFGAALTDASALELDSLPSAEREDTLRSLFQRGDGAGIDVVRVVWAPATSHRRPTPTTMSPRARRIRP